MEPTWQKRRQETQQRDALFSTRGNKASSSSSQIRGHPPSQWYQDDSQGRLEERSSMDSEVIAQRRMVQRALQQHKSTTSSAERSLQIAETCLEIGSVTLEEVSRQGESLDKTERGLDMMEHEVEEAASLIRFMRKCCLFQVLFCCCSDNSADMKRDRTRKRRLKDRRVDDEVVRRAISMASEDKRKHFSDVISNGDFQSGRAPVFNMSPEEEQALKVAAKYHAKGSTATIPFTEDNSRREESNAAVRSGAITEGEIQEISEESLKQDRVLTEIDKTMDKLKSLAETLHEELTEQEPQIDRISDRVLETKFSLNELSRKARKI